MATRFLQSKLWTDISTLSKQATKRYVAVAYLGKGATDLLTMKRGDVLVVDFSLAAVRAGQTNPSEIEKYIRAGVEVYSYSNLHAKVFVFNHTAIIGSANVSLNSRDNLIEAALHTTDSAVVNTARAFVMSLTGERVTPAYLRICKNEFRPPKFASRATDRAHPTLWVQRNYPLKREDPKLNRAYASGLPLAKKRVKNQRLFEVDSLTYSTDSKLVQEAKIGDLFISVWLEDDGKLWAYPPSRIVNFKSYVTQRGKQRTLVFLEVPKSPQCIEWQTFKAALKRGGHFQTGRAHTTSHIRSRLQTLPHWLMGDISCGIARPTLHPADGGD